MLRKLPVRMGSEARISMQCPMVAFVEPSVYKAGGSLNCYTSAYNAPLRVQSFLGVSRVCNGQVSLMQDVNLTLQGQTKPRNRVRGLLSFRMTDSDHVICHFESLTHTFIFTLILLQTHKYP